jgi:hypothetical protein
MGARRREGQRGRKKTDLFNDASSDKDNSSRADVFLVSVVIDTVA